MIRKDSFIAKSSPSLSLQRRTSANPQIQPYPAHTQPEQTRGKQPLPGHKKSSVPIDQEFWRVGKTVHEQAEIDTQTLLATMFHTDLTKFASKPSAAELADHQERQNFTKRLILLLAAGNLQFRETEKGQLHPWKWPLALSLCHGTRILMEVDGDSSPALFNLLTSGSPSHSGSIVKKRTAASHGLTSKGSTLWEEKVKFNVATHLRNMGSHYGIDIPAGGVGNTDYNGYIISFKGQRLHPNTGKTLQLKGKKVQLGHVYLYQRSFKDLNKFGLLLGIEGAAPGFSDPDGHVHDATSAFRSTTDEKTLSGGEKFEKLFKRLHQTGPAKYNGMSITLASSDIGLLKAIMDNILSLPEANQMLFFHSLLLMNGPQAHQKVRGK